MKIPTPSNALWFNKECLVTVPSCSHQGDHIAIARRLLDQIRHRRLPAADEICPGCRMDIVVNNNPNNRTIVLNCPLAVILPRYFNLRGQSS